jgi:hypothetical protein
MKIQCAHCKEFITIPEQVIESKRKRFICHLCQTPQEIKTIQIMERKKAGVLEVSRDGNFIKEFDLFIGVNMIGRTSEQLKSDIEVSGDEYLGRQHFIIEISPNKHGHLEYIIYNNPNRSKPLANVTTVIINNEDIELKKNTTQKIMLPDRSKIIAGKTIFKLKQIDDIEPYKPDTPRDSDKTIVVRR